MLRNYAYVKVVKFNFVLLGSNFFKFLHCLNYLDISGRERLVTQVYINHIPFVDTVLHIFTLTLLLYICVGKFQLVPRNLIKVGTH